MRIATTTFMTCAIILGIASASRAEMDGYWITFPSENEATLGMLFPEYSENELVGLILRCNISNRTVEIFQDTGDTTRQENAVIALFIDGQRVDVDAVSEFNDMNEVWDSVARIRYDSPVVQKIAASKSLALVSDPELLPRQYEAAKNEWKEYCRL